MLQNTEKIVLRSLQILYIFVLRRGISQGNYDFRSNFSSKMVTSFARTTNITNLETLQGYIFRILQYFFTKLCHSSNLKIIFLAVVKDFVLLA